MTTSSPTFRMRAQGSATARRAWPVLLRRTACAGLSLMMLGLSAGPLQAQSMYRKGDIIQDFSLINRATGQPVRLSDYAGKIIFLEWFAWW